MRKYYLFASFFTVFVSFAQTKGEKHFTVKHIQESITPDGVLDEPIWQEAEAAEEFWEYFPSDSVQARKQTQIKMLFDDTHLYVGITVWTEGRDYAIQSLRRDFRAGNSDNITLLFDTFTEPNNPFPFGSNPYGEVRYKNLRRLLHNGMGHSPYLL